jgi:signal transduction histidine kinase
VHLAIDGGRLLAVLINLLDNAAKAGSRQVRVTVSRHSGDGSLIVEDDGPGVSPSVAERAFELGTSGDGGSGWGLAICRELVESVGGEIAYEPNPTGGSRFAVRVPLVAKRAAA